MTRRRSSPAVRRVLAALAVLAALVFQMRVNALGSLQPIPSHTMPMSHDMAGMDMGGGAAVGPPTSTSDGHARHGAHCPFCPANAFALEADAVRAPAGPPTFAVLDVPQSPRTGLLSAGHADARAPPISL